MRWHSRPYRPVNGTPLEIEGYDYFYPWRFCAEVKDFLLALDDYFNA